MAIFETVYATKMVAKQRADGWLLFMSTEYQRFRKAANRTSEEALRYLVYVHALNGGG